MVYSKLLKEGKFKELKKFSLKLWKEKKDKKALSYYGISLILTKEYEKASKYFAKLYKKRKSGIILIYHAMANIGLGRLKVVRKDLLNEIKKEKDVEILFGVFRLFNLIGDNDDAKKAIKKAFGINFNKTVILLSKYYAGLGSDEIGKDTIKLLIKLNPELLKKMRK